MAHLNQIALELGPLSGTLDGSTHPDALRGFADDLLQVAERAARSHDVASLPACGGEFTALAAVIDAARGALEMAEQIDQAKRRPAAA